MRKLGNVLPTLGELEKADRHSDQKAAKASKVEEQLECYEKRNINGETRFYSDATHYAVVSRRDLKIRWFHVTADGDFPISTSK